MTSPIKWTPKTFLFVKDMFNEKIKYVIFKEDIDNCSQNTAYTDKSNKLDRKEKLWQKLTQVEESIAKYSKGQQLQLKNVILVQK